MRSTRLRSDLGSIARHGRHAPFVYQRVWFDPRDCRQRTEDHVFQSNAWTGKVIGGDWDLATEPFSEHPVAWYCHLRWVEGVPWRDTGVYGWLMDRIDVEGEVDGCRTFEDVVDRYRALDRVYEQVRREGRLRPQSELPVPSDRERNGVRICIGRHGQPIFNWAGHHRLAMARILGLEWVPGQLQVVHAAALPSWRKRYARRSRSRTRIREREFLSRKRDVIGSRATGRR